MNKYSSIQALRGIAVLGVLAFHLQAIEKKYLGGMFLFPEFFQLGQTGVDLFFVISGFVMVTVSKGRFGRNGEVLRFLWGRLTRIFPTYWFYFFLTALILFIKPNWVNSSQAQQAPLIFSFLLLPSKQLPLVMVAWTLVHELWFYLVFSLLLNFKEALLLPALLLWGSLIIIVNQLVTVTDLPAGLSIALHPFSLEFVMGSLLAIGFSKEHIPKISPQLAILIIIAVLAVGFPLVFSYDVLDRENITNASTMRVSIIGALYVLLMLSFISLEKTNKLIVPTLLLFIGDVSYTIYLSHVLILSAIGRLWLLVNPMPNSLLANFLVSLTMVVMVVAYGWLGYRLIEQPVLQISHRLRTRLFYHST